MSERKRLHISPFDPSTLSTILPAPVLSTASHVSFHAVQTFPEKNYGYVDLPSEEADKLRKKLNGFFLRGAKMHVEEARPKKLSRREEIAAEEPGTTKTRLKKVQSKKNGGREEGVIPGVELPKERKIRRGWTESEATNDKRFKKRKVKDDLKSKKKKISSITGETECLFKTTVPVNALKNRTGPSDQSVKVTKRKRGESNRDVVVHEFTNTTKHANFLRDDTGSAGTKPPAKYVEGDGWVDENGSVVEAEPKTRTTRAMVSHLSNLRPKKAADQQSSSPMKPILPAVEITAPKTSNRLQEPDDDETSSSGTSSSEDGSDSEASEAPSPTAKSYTKETHPARKISGLGIGDLKVDAVEANRVERLSITRSSATPSPGRADQGMSAAAIEVHPLEALFKRPNNAASNTPKKPALEVSTSFNFFDPDVDEVQGNSLHIPQTPFTQQDFRQRRQRSAAPTPDTAAPGKTFGDVWAGSSDTSSEGGDNNERQIPRSDAKQPTPKPKSEPQESEFSKWFWEHRGENNRAWKRRRREAAKEQRQKENKERKG